MKPAKQHRKAKVDPIDQIAVICGELMLMQCRAEDTLKELQRLAEQQRKVDLKCAELRRRLQPLIGKPIAHHFRNPPDTANKPTNK